MRFIDAKSLDEESAKTVSADVESEDGAPRKTRGETNQDDRKDSAPDRFVEKCGMKS